MFGFSVGRGVGLRVLPAWRAQGLSLIHATAAPRYRTAPGGRRPEPAAGESGVELREGRETTTSPGNQRRPRGWAGLTSLPPSRGYLKCHLLSHVADGIRPVNLIEPRIYWLKPSKTAKFCYYSPFVGKFLRGAKTEAYVDE